MPTRPYQRAAYLISAPQLPDHLIKASGIQAPIIGAEPPDPSPRDQLLMAEALTRCTRHLRTLRPRSTPQHGPGPLPPHLVATIGRLLTLPHASIRDVARRVGVDRQVIAAIARGDYTPPLSCRCPTCGGKLSHPDCPCLLCAIKQSPTHPPQALPQ